MQNPRVVLLLFLCAGLILAGCKEGDPIESDILPAEPSFSPASRPSSVADHYVSLRESSINGGRIFLDVVVTGISEPVSGIAVKLTYPNDFSKFTKCVDGSFFSSGTCISAEPGEGSGDVFLLRSLIAPEAPKAVSGDQVLMRVEFLVFGEGSGSITIEGQNIGGGDTSAVLDANGDPIFVNWYSGVLSGS